MAEVRQNGSITRERILRNASDLRKTAFPKGSERQTPKGSSGQYLACGGYEKRPNRLNDS